MNTPLNDPNSEGTRIPGPGNGAPAGNGQFGGPAGAGADPNLNYGQHSAPRQQYPEYPGGNQPTGGYQAQNPNDYQKQFPDQQQYNGPGTGIPEDIKNHIAPWVLGLSILALLATISIIGVVLGAPLALVTLIFSIIAIVKARKIDGPFRRMGMSVTALILSLLTVIITAVATFGGIAVVSQLSGDCKQYQDDKSAMEQCVQKSMKDRFGIDTQQK